MSFEIADVVLPGQEHSFEIGSREEAADLAALPEEHLALIDGDVTAVLATINPGGNPQLTPVWCNRDDSRLNLNSRRGRVKDRNLRDNGSASLLFLNPDNPYHWLAVYGEVVEIVDEDDPERGQLATDNIDDLSELYLDQRPYPLRDPGGEEVRVLYEVQPRRIVTFGPVE